MSSLFKGVGEHSAKKNWRGVLLADVLGKKLRRTRRKRLVSVADSFLGPLQFGGVAGRGTDMVNHVIRQMQYYAQKAGVSLSVIFIDCVSAFYALIRQLVVPVDVSDEAIAFIMKQLKFFTETMHELYDVMKQASALQQAGAHPLLQRHVAEALSGTWLRVEGSTLLAETHRGSRPGDVFGDVLFHFLVAKIDRSIEEVVQNLGLGCIVPYNGIRTFEQQPLESMSDSAPLPKVSFVDDLAIPVVSKRVAEHIERTAAAATAGINALAKHGLSCNVRAGKSE